MFRFQRHQKLPISYRCSSSWRGWVSRLPPSAAKVTNRRSFDSISSVPSLNSTCRTISDEQFEVKAQFMAGDRLFRPVCDNAIGGQSADTAFDVSDRNTQGLSDDRFLSSQVAPATRSRLQFARCG